MCETKTKGIQLMSRMKSIFAVLVLTAIVGVVPQAYAAPTITLKVVAAGSSAMWQTMALGAFNNQVSIVSGGGELFLLDKLPPPKKSYGLFSRPTHNNPH